MNVQSELSRLLREVKVARTPLDRLRLIGSSWRLLRAMTPGERSDLAVRSGIVGASEIIERLATSQGGHTPLVLMDALRQFKSLTPGDVRWVVKRLQESDGVQQMIATGIEALKKELEPQDEAAAPAVPPLVQTAEAGRSLDQELSALIAATPPAPAPATPVAPVGASLPAQPPAAAQGVEEKGSASVVTPAAVVPAVKSETVAPVPAPAHAPPIVPPAALVPPAPPSIPPPALGMPVAVWLEQWRQAGSDHERLTLLKDAASHTERLQDAPWADALALLRRSSHKRRALVTLIECGLLDSFDQAAAHVETLGVESDRLEILRALARRGALSREHEQRALGIVATITARLCVESLCRRRERSRRTAAR
ncbi:MAG: hypothetical protein MUF51_03725 [Vicinamibacteria bacterium]|jgi:hypothetical protein|nr:hypothetical protein [Vicinamibacteria bacterium]